MLTFVLFVINNITFSGDLYKFGNDSYSCVSNGKVHTISNISSVPWSNLTKQVSVLLFFKDCLYLKLSERFTFFLKIAYI